MTVFILRAFSCLVSAMLTANLLSRSRIWVEGVQSAPAHLEAVLLGVLSGLLIASIASLIKYILSRILLSTRNEVTVASSPRLISDSDEHHHLGDMFSPQVQIPDDQRREFYIADAFEYEMREEMV